MAIRCAVWGQLCSCIVPGLEFVFSLSWRDPFSGGQLKDIVYKLKLDKVKPRASYTLRAKIKGSGGTDSHGVIKIHAGE